MPTRITTSTTAVTRAAAVTGSARCTTATMSGGPTVAAPTPACLPEPTGLVNMTSSYKIEQFHNFEISMGPTMGSFANCLRACEDSHCRDSPSQRASKCCLIQGSHVQRAQHLTRPKSDPPIPAITTSKARVCQPSNGWGKSGPVRRVSPVTPRPNAC